MVLTLSVENIKIWKRLKTYLSSKLVPPTEPNQGWNCDVFSQNSLYVCAWLCPNFLHIFFKYILALINLPLCGSKWISKILNWAWTVFGAVWTCFDPHWTCFGPGSSFPWTIFGPDWTRFGPGSRFVFINPLKNVP